MFKFNIGETVQFIDRDGDEPQIFNLIVLSRIEKKQGNFHCNFYDLATQGSNDIAMANVAESKLRHLS